MQVSFLSSTSYQEYLAPCSDIARQAGRLLMRYAAGGFSTSHKQDKSPVTEADIAANHLIVEALSQLTPHIPVVAEEDKELSREQHERFWLVDPLDGTRSFVRGETEFTVNIGLVQNSRPVFGVIYHPPEDALYYGGMGKAFRVTAGGAAEPIHTREPSSQGLTVVRSQSHPSKKTSAYLETIRIKDLIGMSSAIKFCRVAEGSADLYPRFGRTMEWDTAAGHAILDAAGGRIETEGGQPLLYGKPGFENPAFIAYGK